MKVLLIFAMESELQSFLNRIDYKIDLIDGVKTYRTVLNNVDLYVVKSEVGKVNAAVLTTLMIKNVKPRYVINAGIAGSLVPSLDVLSVVGSTKVMYHDFDLSFFGLNRGEMDNTVDHFNGSKKLLSLLPGDVKKGLIVSGDQFVAGVENLSKINKWFPKALCCEMEGCGIAHACTLLSRPFIIIRAISDNVWANVSKEKYFENRDLAIDKATLYAYNLLLNL